MFNLIRFTDICLELSLTIILAKHDTKLDYVMTRPLIWAAFTSVVRWNCIDWVPAETLDIPNLSIFLQVLQISSGSLPRLVQEGIIETFFPFLIVIQTTNAM
jgi:hypothetical protein